MEDRKKRIEALRARAEAARSSMATVVAEEREEPVETVFEKQDHSSTSSSSSSSSDPAPKRMKFHNYVPHEKELLGALETGTGLSVSSPDRNHNHRNNQDQGKEDRGKGDGNRMRYSKENSLHRELRAMEEDVRSSSSNDTVVHVLPQHPNRDLRSHVEGRLARLARRTQRAVVDMLRDRIATALEEEQQ